MTALVRKKSRLFKFYPRAIEGEDGSTKKTKKTMVNSTGYMFYVRLLVCQEVTTEIFSFSGKKQEYNGDLLFFIIKKSHEKTKRAPLISNMY